MNEKCLDGSHQWEGCKCAKCGETRDHDWSKNCEKCANCEATRKDCHRVQGCQCTVCSAEVHDWTAYNKLAPMLQSRSCRRCGKEDRAVMIDPSDPNDLDAFMHVFGLK